MALGERAGPIRDDVGRADELIPGPKRVGALLADQTASDDPDTQSVGCAHAYSLECAPMNSKSNGSSVAPAAAIACRVSAGLRA